MKTLRPIGLRGILAALLAAPVFGQEPPKAGVLPPMDPRAAVIQGRVTTVKGVPLPGARVRAVVPWADMRFVDSASKHLPIEVVTDGGGRYRLEIPGIEGREKASVDVLMPGFRRLSGTLMQGGDARRVDVQMGTAAEVNLSLEPARYISGTVVDEQGQPIVGARLNANFAFDLASGGIEWTASGPDGSFELFNYAAEPHAFGALKGRGLVFFSHPDHVEYQIDDIDEIPPDARRSIRVVLPTGRKVAGRVLDESGKPVEGALVEYALAGMDYPLKGTKTDAEGRFLLRGLKPGAASVAARALEVRQKARLSLDPDGDEPGVEIRLRPIVLPADLKTDVVLGMKLADLTPELKAIYDIRLDQGALILDPGEDHGRLKIGEGNPDRSGIGIEQGDMLWMVGNQRIATVRGFVDRLLAETGGRDLTEYSIRVVYSFRRPNSVGNMTQHMKITNEDVRDLKAIAARLSAEGR